MSLLLAPFFEDFAGFIDFNFLPQKPVFFPDFCLADKLKHFSLSKSVSAPVNFRICPRYRVAQTAMISFIQMKLNKTVFLEETYNSSRTPILQHLFAHKIMQLHDRS